MKTRVLSFVALLLAAPLQACQGDGEPASEDNDLNGLDEDLDLDQQGSTVALRNNWIASELVQAHYPLSQGYIDKPEFPDAGADLQGIDAPSIVTRHVKGGDEGPWWNTAIGQRFCSPRDVSCTREPAKEILNTHAGKHRVIAYYRDVWEATYARAKPDWLCVDADGKPQEFKHGQQFLSLSSGFKDIVKARLVELAQMGYEGFYFDFKHQPELGCWDRYSVALFREQTGLRPPTAKEASLATAIQRRWMRFHNAQIAAAFDEWRAAVKTVNPAARFVISMSYAPNLTTPHLSSRLIKPGDLIKSEFGIPTVEGPTNGGAFFRRPANSHRFDDAMRKAFAFSLLRGIANDLPPHVWFNLPTKQLSGELLSRGIAGLLAMGTIANVMIYTDFRQSSDVADAYRSGFSNSAPWVDVLRDYPTKEAEVGVFFSERLRWTTSGDRNSFWDRGNTPAMAAFEVVHEAGVPVAVVVDRNLNAGLPPGMKVLVVMNPFADLSRRQQASVRAFKKAGGTVYFFPGLKFGAADYEASKATMRTALREPCSASALQVEFPGTATSRVFGLFASENAGEKLLVIPRPFANVDDPARAPSQLAAQQVGVRVFFADGPTPPIVRDALNTSAPPLRATRASDNRWVVTLPDITGDLGMFLVD